MTFQEWWNNNYKRFKSMWERDVAYYAWQEATQVERERCARVADKQAELYKQNTVFPAYNLDTRVDECEFVARQIRQGA